MYLDGLAQTDEQKVAAIINMTWTWTGQDLLLGPQRLDLILNVSTPYSIFQVLGKHASTATPQNWEDLIPSTTEKQKKL